MSEFAGTLNQRVVISRLAEQRTELGMQAAGWEPVAACLASVVADGTGAEAEGMALSAMSRFRVTNRTRDGVAVGHRIQWRERTLEVRQRIDDPRTPDRILLRCEEIRS